MSRLYSIGLTALFLSLSISCGSTAKSTQFVHVDGAVYAPAPKASQDSRPSVEYVNNSDALARTRNNESTASPSKSASERVYNNVSNSTANSYSSQQNASPFVLANTYVYGAYRGYGHGQSSSLTAAYKMATTRAAQDALEKISLVIDSFSNDEIASLNTAGMEDFKMQSKTYTRACIRAVKVVATERRRGQLNEVEHCVEISAEDVIESLAPILEKLNAADRKRVEESIKKAEVQ